MTLDDRIATLKDLFKKREDIDKQIADIMNGGTGKKLKCSVCGSTEHNASFHKKQEQPLSTPAPPAAPASPLTFAKL